MRAIRSAPELSSLLLLGGLAACGGSDVSVELVFPSAEAVAAATSIGVTVVEPFALSEDGFSPRRVVRCGELGVFPPTATYDRSGTDPVGLPDVILNREVQNYPLDGGWSLDFGLASVDPIQNPWQAVMVHFEARGLARAQGPDGLGDPATTTLLEGCFCVRLDPTASGPDPAIDQQVKEACVARSEIAGLPVPVELQPVAPPAFQLAPCGVDTLTAPRGQVLSASPSFCLRTVRCGETGAGRFCFTCRDPSCQELGRLRNVPLRIQVEGSPTVDGDILLTDDTGRATPSVAVGNCTGPFRIQASVFGRSEIQATYEVECVPAMRFDEPPGGALELGASQDPPAVVGVSAIPPARGRSAGQVAVFGQTSVGAQLTVLEAGPGGARVVLTTTIGDPGAGEKARAVLGYHYVRGRQPEDADVPVVAVATSVFLPRPNDPQSRREVVRVRIYAVDGGALRLIARSEDRCSVCACQRPDNACAECTCEQGFNLTTTVNLEVSDIDVDGFADLSVGVSTDFPLVTYYSGGRDLAALAALGQLDRTCSCAGYGKLLSAFELVRLGGTDLNSELTNTDFVVGDVAGALAVYAEGSAITGNPCDPALPSAGQCSAGLECQALCASGAGGVCVEPCGADGLCSSAIRPTCTATSADPGAPKLCGGAALPCRGATTIWRLVIVRKLQKLRLTNSGFEDVLALASVTPTPGADDRGLLRIMFGDTLDLRRIEQESAEVRARHAFDLRPQSFDGSFPQGPRSAQPGDFNGDGLQDLAVLYGGSQELHFWVGGGNRGPGEAGVRVQPRSVPPCFLVDEFAVTDLDGDGLDDVITVCTRDGAQPTVRWFRSAVEGR